MRPALRLPLAIALLVLGAYTTLAGAVLLDARRGLFNAEGFADRSARALGDPRVAAYAGDAVTDAVLRAAPDLTAYRPLIVVAAREVVASEPFRLLVRTTARQAHRAAFSRSGRDVLLAIPDVDVLLRTALGGVNSPVAARIPREVTAFLTSLQTDRTALQLLSIWRFAGRVVWFSTAAFIVGPLLLFAGVWIAPRRRRGLVWAGGALAAGGLGLLLIPRIGAGIAPLVIDGALAGPAAAGLWSVFTARYVAWGVGIAGVGMVLAAAGSSLLERVDPFERARTWGRFFIATPTQMRWRFVRAIVLLVVGGLTAWRPAQVAAVVTLIMGAALAYLGLRELFTMVLARVPTVTQTLPTGLRHTNADGDDDTEWFVGAAVIGVLAIAVATAMVVMVRTVAIEPVEATDGGCNGAAALCERRIDQVVFPATHNAMSSADQPGWLFPNQERGIATQLADGVRGLLIDVHYGIPVGDRVRTDLDSERSGMRAKATAALGEEGTAAAMRIRDRLVGGKMGVRDVYLCHGFCELGALPLVDALRTLHDFLITHPREVVILDIEDYVEPADLARAFEAASLTPYVWKGDPAGGWPTLGALIAADTRVLVFLESGATGVPWMRPTYESFQETPYAWPTLEAMTCASNRGPATAPLFLLNHWVETTPTPKPSNAALANAFAALDGRAKRCEAERRRVPTLLAVDFYRTGDLISVARALNGLPPSPPSRP
ncbi:MAG: hypothetical protein MUF00_19300 [Gemmatimonadaceae bacterium]|nr:hypothetical protein [Gemmatimonadaceae bacterium]